MLRRTTFINLIVAVTIGTLPWLCACESTVQTQPQQPATIAVAPKYYETELQVDNTATTVEAHVWDPGTSSPRTAIIFVTGVDGGFIEPVDEMYSRTALTYVKKNVLSIFVTYRFPGELEPSVNDALAAVSFARARGVKQIALIGWSFGGAVIINTAVQAPEVNTVIGVAPQARDTERVAEFQKQSLILFHSEMDENVPFESSGEILDSAPEYITKKLVSFPTGDHYLTGMSEQVDAELLPWLDNVIK
jgi:dienelactone hydrolase